MTTQSEVPLRTTGVPGGEEALPTVAVRFWAGARAAAGVEGTDVAAATVGELRAALVAWRAALGPVLEVSSVLVDGRTATDDATPVTPESTVEILPPFAGG